MRTRRRDGRQTPLSLKAAASHAEEEEEEEEKGEGRENVEKEGAEGNPIQIVWRPHSVSKLFLHSPTSTMDEKEVVRTCFRNGKQYFS